MLGDFGFWILDFGFRLKHFFIVKRLIRGKNITDNQ